MSLGSALVDRATIRRDVETGERVEGEYLNESWTSPVFRCFYEPGSESESRSDGGTRRQRSGATLIVGKRAIDGSTIDIKAQDRIVIDSRRHGTVTMYVSGTPEAIAKRRTRIGWMVRLTAVARDGASG